MSSVREPGADRSSLVEATMWSSPGVATSGEAITRYVAGMTKTGRSEDPATIASGAVTAAMDWGLYATFRGVRFRSLAAVNGAV